MSWPAHVIIECGVWICGQHPKGSCGGLGPLSPILLRWLEQESQNHTENRCFSLHKHRLFPRLTLLSDSKEILAAAARESLRGDACCVAYILRWSEAASEHGEKEPAFGYTLLIWVLDQLLANLAVDLIPENKIRFRTLLFSRGPGVTPRVLTCVREC